MNYFVSWEFETEAADPIEAAKIAREAQAREGTRSTVFQVWGEDGSGPVGVDLCELAEQGESRGAI